MVDRTLPSKDGVKHREIAGLIAKQTFELLGNPRSLRTTPATLAEVLTIAFDNYREYMREVNAPETFVQPSIPPCPGCRKPLHEVRQSSGSMLNSDQFDAVRAGDWYCDTCPSNGRGNTAYAYFWNSELRASEKAGELQCIYRSGCQSHPTCVAAGHCMAPMAEALRTQANAWKGSEELAQETRDIAADASKT